jgi:hypothetical protein
LAIVGFVVALIGVPLIPTSPCIKPAESMPNSALISIVGLVVAGFAVVLALSSLPSDSQGSVRSRIAIAIGIALGGGTAWMAVAMLALNRTKGWSCAGG